MKFLFILLIASLLQTSFLPVNLTLVLLLVRLLVYDEPANLPISFLAGLILGLLSLINLAFYPLLFITISKLISLFKYAPLSSNAITNLLIGGAILIISGWLELLILKQDFSLAILAAETLTFIPLYIGGRLIIENFYVKKPLKLRV